MKRIGIIGGGAAGIAAAVAAARKTGKGIYSGTEGEDRQEDPCDGERTL